MYLYVFVTGTSRITENQGRHRMSKQTAINLDRPTLNALQPGPSNKLAPLFLDVRFFRAFACLCLLINARRGKGTPLREHMFQEEPSPGLVSHFGGVRHVHVKCSRHLRPLSSILVCHFLVQNALHSLPSLTFTRVWPLEARACFQGHRETDTHSLTHSPTHSLAHSLTHS